MNWDVLKVSGCEVSPQPWWFYAFIRPGSSLSNRKSNLCRLGWDLPLQFSLVLTMFWILSLFSPYVSREGELLSWKYLLLKTLILSINQMQREYTFPMPVHIQQRINYLKLFVYQTVFQYIGKAWSGPFKKKFRWFNFSHVWHKHWHSRNPSEIKCINKCVIN
jgi:hypothetical protein